MTEPKLCVNQGVVNRNLYNLIVGPEYTKVYYRDFCDAFLCVYVILSPFAILPPSPPLPTYQILIPLLSKKLFFLSLSHFFLTHFNFSFLVLMESCTNRDLRNNIIMLPALAQTTLNQFVEQLLTRCKKVCALLNVVIIFSAGHCKVQSLFLTRIIAESYAFLNAVSILFDRCHLSGLIAFIVTANVCRLLALLYFVRETLLSKQIQFSFWKINIFRLHGQTKQLDIGKTHSSK